MQKQRKGRKQNEYACLKIKILFDNLRRDLVFVKYLRKKFALPSVDTFFKRIGTCAPLESVLSFS